MSKHPHKARKKARSFSDTLLPEHLPLPNWGRFLLIAVLLASPAALAVGYRLTTEIIARQQLAFGYDREQAIGLARDIATGRGLSTEGWKSYVVFNSDESLYAYYRRDDTAERRLLRRAVPSVVAVVHLVRRNEDGSLDSVITSMGPQGDLVDYKLSLSSPHGPDPGDDAAFEAAREILATHPRRTPFQGPPEVSVKDKEDDQGKDEVTRTFTWKTQWPDSVGAGDSGGSGEWKATFQVDMVNDRVVETSIKAKIDSEASGAVLDSPAVRAGLAAASVMVLLGMGVYCFVRYVRRTQQKEVSHRRTLTVAALVTFAFSLVTLVNMSDQMGKDLVKAPWWVYYVAVFSVIAAFGILGLLLGAAWSACEADVRTLYPKKLTSLDTLAAGHLPSGNVGYSITVGLAIASWLVLASAAVQWPWIQHPQAGVRPENLGFILMAHFPWVFALASPIFGTVLFASGSLLTPLSIHARLVRKRSTGLRRFLVPLLALFSISPLLATGLHGAHPLAAALAVAVTTLTALLAAFFFFDLLTAIVALGASQYICSLAIMKGTGMTMPFDFYFSWLLFGLAGVLAVTAAWRGRFFLPSEVRPLFARHLEHRQAMQAEISAARQAQLRLSPQSLPQVTGIELAAECRPSREVGGDFYDFYRLDESRVGLLLAEGGGQGLSAALAIAYAKGLAMPLVAEAASPVEVLSVLREKLRPLVQEATMGLLYAVVDVAERRLEFARFGDYPRLLVSPQDHSGQLQERQGPDSIRYAGSRIEPGTRALFFTDGVMQALEAERAPAEDWLRQFLDSQRDAEAEDIHESFRQALESRTRRRRVEDDVSWIVLRLGSGGALRRTALPEEEVA